MMYGWIIGAIVVIISVIIGRSGLLKGNFPITTGSIATISAMETLKNRYAKGEIDEAELEKKKADLEKAN